MKFATKIQSIIKLISGGFFILHIYCEDMKHATDMIRPRSAVWYSKYNQFVSTLELFKVTFNKKKSKMLLLTDYVWLKGLLFSFVHHINSNM
jgi:DNA integrity scanning protein DisA with diadenylate cyclase activity